MLSSVLSDVVIILLMIPLMPFCHQHFIHREIKGQRGERTAPRSMRWLMGNKANSGTKPACFLILNNKTDISPHSTSWAGASHHLNEGIGMGCG